MLEIGKKILKSKMNVKKERERERERKRERGGEEHRIRTSQEDNRK